MSDNEEEESNLYKMQEAKPKSQAIGEFIEWLHTKKIFLCKWNTETHEYDPVRTPIEHLLAEHFDIDLAKVEREKQAIIDQFTKQGIKT